MRSSVRPRPGRSRSRGIALGVGLVVLLAACAAPGSSGGPLGFDSAPAGFDPRGPSLSATNVAFDRTDLRVPAARAFVLVFQNRERLPHNISIYRDAEFRDRIFEGIVFEGAGTRWYPVPALALGATYFFQCDVHPIPPMQGTMTPGL